MWLFFSVTSTSCELTPTVHHVEGRRFSRGAQEEDEGSSKEGLLLRLLVAPDWHCLPHHCYRTSGQLHKILVGHCSLAKVWKHKEGPGVQVVTGGGGEFQMSLDW